MTKRRPDLPQGTFDMLVLKALSLGPMHGFGIGQRIRQLAEDMLTVEEAPSIRPSIASRSAAGSRGSGACLRTSVGLASTS